MNPQVSITIGNADPNASPLTVNELFDLLQTVVTGEITGSYIPYVLGHDVPGVDDQDKAWIELDTGGRPLSVKVFYNGNWRRVYNGMIGEIRGFTGDPSIIADWDTNGHGAIGGKYDGWQICNGKNGSPNLSDKFLLGGHMDNSGGHNGYSGGWQATIEGPNNTADYKTGGRFIETLAQDNLPLLSNAQAGDDPGLWIYGKEAKNGTDHPSAVPIIDINFANLQPHAVNLTGNDTYGKNPPDPVWTTPPFVALGWIVFQGYS